MLPKEEMREKDEKFATTSTDLAHSNNFRIKEERPVDSSNPLLEESEQTSDKPQNGSVKYSS